jgi:putative ABC transport system permease protein
MIKNYLKIAWRNLVKSKGTSLINILGLSIGLTVVLVIGLWIYDEMTFNNNIPGNKFIVQVLQNQTNNGKTETQEASPPVLADELRKSYPDDFKYIVQTSWNYEHLITYNQNHFKQKGSYCQTDFLKILSIELLSGVNSALDDPYSL